MPADYNSKILRGVQELIFGKRWSILPACQSMSNLNSSVDWDSLSEDQLAGGSTKALIL